MRGAHNTLDGRLPKEVGLRYRVSLIEVDPARDVERLQSSLASMIFIVSMLVASKP